MVACREYAVGLGWGDLAVYEDNDRSAWSGRPRPAYERLLVDIAGGVVSALVTYNVDRLTRHPKELEHFIEVVAGAGLRAIHTVTGDIDLSSSDGQLHARILGAFARKESDNLSRRLKARYAADRAAGIPMRGRRPFGYTTDRLRVVPGEARVIRGWARRALSGVGLHTLAREANEAGVSTVMGGSWAPQVIRQILVSPRLAGLYTVGSGSTAKVIGEGAWPAILDLDTHHALVQHYRRPGNRKVGRTRWLTGILYCQACETAMSGNGNAEHYWYGCRACGRAVMKHLAEDTVRDLLIELDRLDRERPREQFPVVSTSELDDIAAQREELAKLYGSGRILVAEWMDARDTLDERETQLRGRLEDERANAAPAVPLTVESWEEMTLTQRAAAGRRLVGWVDVGPPGPRGTWDPERLWPGRPGGRRPQRDGAPPTRRP